MPMSSITRTCCFQKSKSFLSDSRMLYFVVAVSGPASRQKPAPKGARLTAQLFANCAATHAQRRIFNRSNRIVRNRISAAEAPWYEAAPIDDAGPGGQRNSSDDFGHRRNVLVRAHLVDGAGHAAEVEE